MEAGIAATKQGKLVQECAAGLVELAVGDGALSFRLPRYAVEDAPGGEEATAERRVVGERTQTCELIKV